MIKEGRDLCQDFPEVKVEFSVGLTEASIKVSSEIINTEEYEFTFVIFRDQKVVGERRWLKESFLKLDVIGGGVYYAQVEYRKRGEKKSVIVRTRTVEFFPMRLNLVLNCVSVRWLRIIKR